MLNIHPRLAYAFIAGVHLTACLGIDHVIISILASAGYLVLAVSSH